MRSILVLAILTAPSSALADRLPDIIDPNTIPARCRQLAHVPPAAAITTPSLSARVSLATCLAEIRFSEITPRDATALVPALDRAAADSLALLDEVASVDDPAWKLIAEQARGSLLVAMATRVRAAVPRERIDLPEITEAARFEVETAIAPWLSRADTAFATVMRIADAHPELATDRLIRNLERQARLEQTARNRTARRTPGGLVPGA
jgi:hypothetical protein